MIHTVPLGPPVETASGRNWAEGPLWTMKALQPIFAQAHQGPTVHHARKGGHGKNPKYPIF